jgi:hypothetical protein
LTLVSWGGVGRELFADAAILSRLKPLPQERI